MNWGAQQTENFSSDFFDGMQLTYPERWQKWSGGRNTATLIKRKPDFNKVAIVISGGGASGPLFPGYVGDGLADAAVTGGPYAAPNAYCLYEVGKYLGKEKGVLFLYNNFAGDFLNNDMAQELLEIEGILVESVMATDDIASALGEEKSKRGGRCGVALLIKIAAYCAQQNMSLAEIASIVRQANTRLATLSIEVDFEKQKIFYGNGFSGEKGFRSETHMNMKKTAQEAIQMLLDDVKPQKEESLVFLINRLRYTSYSDGYFMAKYVSNIFKNRFSLAQLRVANYSNIIDAYGFNFTVLCADKQLLDCLREDVYTDSFIL